MKTFEIGVCKGRHEMPCNYYVFEGEIENPMDFDGMTLYAWDKLREILKDSLEKKEKIEVKLYVTGLTAAVISCLKCLNWLNIETINLMHYDTETGIYKGQTWCVYGADNIIQQF